MILNVLGEWAGWLVWEGDEMFPSVLTCIIHRIGFSGSFSPVETGLSCLPFESLAPLELNCKQNESKNHRLDVFYVLHLIASWQCTLSLGTQREL
jgi:hypothetical protein